MHASRRVSGDHSFPVMVDTCHSIIDEGDAGAQRYLVDCFVQPGAVDVHGAQLNVERRFSEPLGRNVMLRRAIRQLQSHMPLIGRSTIRNELLHGQPQCRQKFRSGPIQRFSHRISIPDIRAYAQHVETALCEMDGCRHRCESRAHHCHVYRRCTFGHLSCSPVVRKHTLLPISSKGTVAKAYLCIAQIDIH